MIALFAMDDKHFAHFDTLVKELSRSGLRLLTTWPCVGEACHILNVPQRLELLRWLELGGAVVYSFEITHLPDMIRRMRKYSEFGKREMDFADASLVWLAEETEVTDILTVNVADFTRYRLSDGRSFHIL
ncbi:MAG: hypothetical protein HQL56_12030 [Magnetococcales bacterium]|nr:hypothetical protein [Magnetococcales bacterium]